MKIVICIALIVSVAVAAVVKRQAVTNGVFNLPDGAELIVGSITGGFTCDDKIYGYYADPANECRIFHVCVPQTDSDGNQATPLLFSFFCGNQTVFDQQYLVCASFEAATPCSEATNYYFRNENFGRTDVPFISDQRK